jgi:membrane protease subunit HflK
MQGGALLRRNGARRVVTGRGLTYNRSQLSKCPAVGAASQEIPTMPWSNQGGGPWGSGGGGKGPWGSGQQPSGGGSSPPDLEELLRRSQDKLRTVLPGGNLGGKGVLLLILAALLVWGLSGFYRVDTNEYGVVLRFGAFDRYAGPGLNYHLPYPIETALTPQITVVRQIHIGMRQVDDLRRGTSGTSIRDVPEESLMLTGDENIVDVDFTVFWQVKKDKVSDFLFNIQQVENSVKAVAESAMREVTGRTSIQPILTGARAGIELEVQELTQKILDFYGAGVVITQVQMAKVDPPLSVIDSQRDVQVARADAEKAQNEAQRYANSIVPEARGKAAKIQQDSEAYREQTVAEAKGQAARFLKVYDEYKKAPEVTRQRIYYETMEKVFNGTEKIIMDPGAATSAVPYLPLPELTRPAQRPAQTTQPGGAR